MRKLVVRQREGLERAAHVGGHLVRAGREDRRVGRRVGEEAECEVELAARLGQADAVHPAQRGGEDVHRVGVDALGQRDVHALESDEDVLHRAAEVAVVADQRGARAAPHAVAAEQELVREEGVGAAGGRADAHAPAVRIDVEQALPVVQVEPPRALEAVVEEARERRHHKVAVDEKRLALADRREELGAADDKSVDRVLRHGHAHGAHVRLVELGHALERADAVRGEADHP